WEWHYLKRLCNSGLKRVRAGRPEGLQVRLRALSQDAGRLAIVDAKNFVHIYDTATGEDKVAFPIRDQWSDQVCLSQDGKRLATMGGFREQDKVQIWDAGTGERLAVLNGLKNPGARAFGFWGAAFSPDTQCLAATDKKGNLFAWDIATGKV